MAEPRTTTGTEQRREPRLPLDATVTVDVPAAQIVGSGENISSQGVFFTAEARLPVTVRIAGRDVEVEGELVRCESMGDGRVGLAIRFLAPLPDTTG